MEEARDWGRQGRQAQRLSSPLASHHHHGVIDDETPEERESVIVERHNVRAFSRTCIFHLIQSDLSRKRLTQDQAHIAGRGGRPFTETFHAHIPRIATREISV